MASGKIWFNLPHVAPYSKPAFFIEQLWSLHQVGGTADKMYLSKHTEDPAETWDNEEPEGEEHQVHTTLKRAVEPLCGEAHKLAIETSSIFFEETMRKTLNLIRLFTH